MGYLCERTPFLSVLKLRHPSVEGPQHAPKGGEKEREQGPEHSWTAWDVCEGKDHLQSGSRTSGLVLNC